MSVEILTRFQRTPLPRFLFRVLPALVLVLVAVTPNAARADIWGYEDAFGIVHLQDSQLDERYVLVHQGPQTPHIGFEDIRRIIREKGGVAPARNEAWIDENVPATPVLRPLSHVRPSPEIAGLIDAASVRYGVDKDLILAVMEQESGFNARAVSARGAQGLMQIMPDTQQLLGLSDPFNPAGNVDAGVRYLRMMLDRFVDLRLALAAYNAGPDAVLQYSGVPPFAETTQYVAQVILRYSALKGL